MNINFWSQVFYLIVGGFMGGLGVLAANTLHRRVENGAQKRNIARAITAEISALANRIEREYLVRLDIEIAVLKSERRYPSHPFRGQSELGQVFHSLGPSIGHLPYALAEDLVCWYVGLSIYLERAKELFELSQANSAELIDYTIEVSELQRSEFSELVERADCLVSKLRAC